jgi:TPP-dependent pyruvate/acetoin dehydrogenase alpha subunit
MIRNLGAVLTRGISLDDVFLNYLARGSGPTHGKDNVVHFGTVDGRGHFVIDRRGGMVSPISQLGPLISVLAGMALAARLQGRPMVALTYSGDGATATGEFHEGMCFAAAQRTPFVVIVENNGYAYSTPTSRASAVSRLAFRAKAYGIPAVTIDGNDVEEVVAATREMVERARGGGGPGLIEALTFRMKGHAQHDDQHYVAKDLLESWAKKDPILRTEIRLKALGVLDDARLAELRTRLSAGVDEAAERALAAPPPEPGTVADCVYA